MKMWGFEAKKGQKVHPNFSPNITMEFYYHAFYAPEMSLLTGSRMEAKGVSLSHEICTLHCKAYRTFMEGTKGVLWEE